jgi:hypothetical protein
MLSETKYKEMKAWKTNSRYIQMNFRMVCKAKSFMMPEPGVLNCKEILMFLFMIGCIYLHT